MNSVSDATLVPQKRVFVVDTETNGLLPRFDRMAPHPPIEAYPYILQLSFAIYNVNTGVLEDFQNHYIKVSKDVPISPEVSALNGITHEVCEKRGIPICDALLRMYDAYMKCNHIVAHNLAFDSVVIQREIERNMRELMYMDVQRSPYMPGLFRKLACANRGVELYCTMMNSINICKIEAVNMKTGLPYLKYPKLNELYNKLFYSEAPTGLHNSGVDILVCLQCFLEMNGLPTIPAYKFRHMCKLE